MMSFRVAERTADALLTIDLDAVAANTRLFAERTAGELIAVVKADGYGHGAADVAATALANGASRLGVARLDEALALRDQGLSAPIISWLTDARDDAFAPAVDAGIELAVPSLAHLLSLARTDGVAKVHLHLDTGLARDGAEPARWIDLCRAAREAEFHGQVRVVGIMGHLAEADDPAAPSNSTGRRRFEWAVDVARLCGLRPHLLHLAATSATLTLPATHYSASRVGAGLVGIDLSRTTRLRQPMTLTAPLLAVRSVAAGTPAGYGHDWAAPRATRLGLVGLGYADGIPRSSAAGAHVLVRGRRVALAGRISMDQLVVDLADTGAMAGDEVTLFGPGDRGEPTIADWAGWSDTIEHEIVTRVGARVRRSVTATTLAVGARA
ncbi:alanine racemase [Herbiconiux daphne]|uniref:Alanine racemase n=1 Tax=Herbiconiux daphne TaxID=2970914 RepID=A0ABT2GYC1_9MICO|nr:alanine racemase [Herbiconiux daphne]MCS5732913.1 alanine racemase [Herbiconiux daphne]